MYGLNGDVIFHKIESIPSGVALMGGDLIHKGENHHHRISGEFKLYGGQDVEYVECLSDCELLHEEHKTRTLPAGNWRKTIALEYDHLHEESRQVID
jgi:hypothetical protein